MSTDSGRYRAASQGLSVIVCCHNSEHLPPQTLAHLSAQRTPPGIAWELILVDNASTDRTAEVARSLWADVAPAPLRIVHESTLGLSAARARGVSVASFDLVGFVDDDNWLDENWVTSAVAVMREFPEAGACGGVTYLASDGKPPSWFEACKMYYAVSLDHWRSGDCSVQRGSLWGAGLVVHTEALADLAACGFQPMLQGREGQGSVAAGEDVELCLALRLAGRRLFYDTRLSLRHYMPPRRLTWRYARRLVRGSGQMSPRIDAYHLVLQAADRNLQSWKLSWWWQAAVCIRNLLRHPLSAALSWLRPDTYDPHMVHVELTRGRVAGLWSYRAHCKSRIAAVRSLERRFQHQSAPAAEALIAAGGAVGQ